MSPEAVQALEARDMAKYGNRLSPTADQQFAKYGSWEAVIDAATRSHAAIDQELGPEPTQAGVRRPNGGWWVASRRCGSALSDPWGMLVGPTPLTGRC
ncbi:hypothetical protein [Streptomyces sp. NPDC018000]|uniref:hypothetical protein n=1 Tax=Streptomyces sp. NPDC018000 TaxID=3365028 RepID=UPI0037884840